MDIGKLPPEILEKLVLDKLTTRRKEVIVRSKTGQDSVFIDTGGLPIVTSSDPITGGVDNIGWFALHIACNDLAANGAMPIGVMMTVLLPPGYKEEELGKLMDDASQAAKELDIDIIGGHTEVTDAVTRPIISSTALGIPMTDSLIISEAAKPGMDIILTKGAGIEGSAILASVKEEELKKHIGIEYIKAAKELEKQLSVVPESIIAAKHGVAAMHDVTEGGVLGALYEVVQAAGCGFTVNYEAIPILECTKKISQYFNIDPLKLISSGSMLMFTTNGEQLVEKLAREGIYSAVIGIVTEAGYVLNKNGNDTEVDPPKSDELWKVI